MRAQIRPAVVTDVDAILTIRTQVRENRMSLPELARSGMTRQGIAHLLSAMGDDAPCLWGAQRQGGVVGFSMADQEEASLFAAFILPQHEGLGVGRMLVAAAEAALFRNHADLAGNGSPKPGLWILPASGPAGDG